MGDNGEVKYAIEISAYPAQCQKSVSEKEMWHLSNLSSISVWHYALSAHRRNLNTSFPSTYTSEPTKIEINHLRIYNLKIAIS